jgi:hypothetical protein
MGIQRAYLRVASQLRKILEPATSISLTGHSLGGALAVMASFDLLVDDYPVKNVYVYGTPKIGTDDFEEAFTSVVVEKDVDNERIIASQNIRVSMFDPVPRMYFYSGPRKAEKQHECFHLREEKPSRFRLHLHLMTTYYAGLKQMFAQYNQCASLEKDKSN